MTMSNGKTITGIILIMKLHLKDIKKTNTTVEVNNDDKVDEIRLKLIGLGKVPNDVIVRLICKNTILDLTKKISEYDILKDGETVIYLATKQKLGQSTIQSTTQSTQNPSTTQTTSQAPASNQLPSNDENNEPEVTPLPTMLHGININNLRQFFATTVINRVLSTPQVFREILLQDPSITQLRNASPADFDSLVNHPDFLGTHNIVPMNPDGDAGLDNGDFNMFPMPVLDNNDSSNGTSSNSGNGNVRLQISQEDKHFIEEVCKMVPGVSAAEVMQYYLICEKNKDATVNMVLSNASDLNYDE